MEVALDNFLQDIGHAIGGVAQSVGNQIPAWQRALSNGFWNPQNFTKAAANVQQGIANSQTNQPLQVNLPKPIANIPVLGGLANSLANTPGQFVQGISRTAGDISGSLGQRGVGSNPNPTPQNYLGDIAQVGQLPLTFAGAGAVNKVTSPFIGALTGGGFGAGSGFLSGLQQGRNAGTVAGQLQGTIAPTALGAAVGGAVGAATPLLKTIQPGLSTANQAEPINPLPVNPASQYAIASFKDSIDKGDLDSAEQAISSLTGDDQLHGAWQIANSLNNNDPYKETLLSLIRNQVLNQRPAWANPDVNAAFNANVDAATSRLMGGPPLQTSAGFDNIQAAPITGNTVEQAEGWRPGMKQQFDMAMLMKNGAAIRQMLPQIPPAYAAKFANEIRSLISK